MIHINEFVVVVY